MTSDIDVVLPLDLGDNDGGLDPDLRASPREQAIEKLGRIDFSRSLVRHSRLVPFLEASAYAVVAGANVPCTRFMPMRRRSRASLTAPSVIAGLAALVATMHAQSEATASMAPDEPAIPALVAADLPAWREYLLPRAGELAWQEIPWLPTFTAGVLRAGAEEKPLLFWAMNGHPLGCT